MKERRIEDDPEVWHMTQAILHGLLGVQQLGLSRTIDVCFGVLTATAALAGMTAVELKEVFAASVDVTFAGPDEQAAVARYHASICHRHHDGWEWSWPIVFRVKNLATGKMYDIEIERDMVPEFVAGKPKEVP